MHWHNNNITFAHCTRICSERLPTVRGDFAVKEGAQARHAISVTRSYRICCSFVDFFALFVDWRFWRRIWWSEQHTTAARHVLLRVRSRDTHTSIPPRWNTRTSRQDCEHNCTSTLFIQRPPSPIDVRPSRSLVEPGKKFFNYCNFKWIN